MKAQTFELKRIVQLSKELDSERDKNAKLIRQSIFLNNKVKESDQQLQQSKQKILQMQITLHKMSQKLKEFQQQNLTIRNQVQSEVKLRSDSQIENIRQRQKIDQIKEEMGNYQSKTKALLYETTNQLAAKEKQIYKLREENIDIEKLSMNKRETYQKKEQKRVKEMAKLFQEFENLKKEIEYLKTHYEKMIANEKQKTRKQIEQMTKKIESLSKNNKRQQLLQQQIIQMKEKLEEIVSENSQRIIELYKYKYLNK